MTSLCCHGDVANEEIAGHLPQDCWGLPICVYFGPYTSSVGTVVWFSSVCPLNELQGRTM